MTDKPIGNMKFGIGVDGIDKTISSLDELQRKIKQAESSMKANAKAFDDGGKSIDSMGQKTKDLTSLMGLEENKMKILETRREKAIETYGKESKQVDKLNTEINKSIAKYNGYSSQLGKVTTALDKQLVSSSKYGTQIEANNKIMEREIAIAKKSGNEVDIVKAKQKAYAANLEITKQAVIDQTREVDRLTKEYGESSSEVEKAKRQLTAYSNTSKDTKQELTKLDKELTVAQKSMKGVSTESKGASREGSKLDGVMSQLKKTVGGVQGSFSKGFSGITNSISKASKGVGMFVGAGVLGAVASVGAKAFGKVTSSVDAAVKRIDTLNNSTRAFENMGFNPKQITKGMEDLQAATKGLPTSLSDAVSNVQLLSASTEDIDLSVSVFKAMNDAILGFGGDVNQVDNAVVQLSQAFSNGKIDAGTWNSMINSGLGPTLSALAKKMNMTTGQLKEGLSEGTVSVKQFQEELIDLDKNGGGGLKSLEQIAKDSSKGISTSLANMKTAIVRGTANLIQGIDDSLKNMGLPSIDDWITNAGAKFEKALSAIGKNIPELAKKFKFVGDIFVGLNLIVGQTVSDLGRWFGAIASMFTGEGWIDAKKLGISAEDAMNLKLIIKDVKSMFDDLKYTMSETFNIDVSDISIFETIADMLSSITSTIMLNVIPVFVDFGKMVAIVFGDVMKWSTALKRMFTGEGWIDASKLGISAEDALNIKVAFRDIKDSLRELKEGIISAFSFGESDIGLFETLGNLVTLITAKVIPIILPVIAKAIKFITNAVLGIIEVFKVMVGIFQTVIWPMMKPILSNIVTSMSEIFQTLNDWWSKSGSRVLEAIKNFLILLTPLFKLAWSITAAFVDNVIGLVKGLVSVLTGIIDVFSMVFTGDFSGMWDAIKRIFFGSIQVLWNWVQLLLFGKMIKGLKGFVAGFSGGIKAMWEGVKKFFTSGIGDAIGQVNGWISKVLGSGNTLKTSFTNIIRALWDGIKKVFSGGIDTVVKWMTDLPSQLGSAISKGAKYVTKAFKGIFNGALKAIGGPVNGIIGGANWVLEKFGAKPIAKWEVPKYADGTEGHPGGMMMVNDGRGAEIVERPNGEMFIPQGKNVTMYGERGTKVYTAEETAMALGHKRPKYRYKKGTGKSLFDKIGGAVGDVWNFIKSPFDLAKKALTNAVDFTGISHVPLDMAKGLLNTSVKAFGNTVKKMFDEDFSTKIGPNGVYQYLENIAKHLIGKFGGLRVTSGYREGDPYSHGSRNAIDVAFPASMNGSSKNTEVADYAFNEFKKKIGYVITNGRVRDREGTSGTGIHDGWINWPDNDHYDHIHLNGIKRFMGNSKQGTGLMATGSGVARWRSTAAQALYMTGQYSKSNLDKLMYQMQTESNGNPRAINNWDSNAAAGTPSKGLMQVIDPTFRAYAMRGYNSNIYDPLSNILASIRYAMARYGSLSAAYRGTGYKNGGVVTQAGMYDLVENGYPEIVIPTEPAKRGRAMMLLNQAKTMLGVKDNQKVKQSTNDSNMSSLLTLMIEQNQLLKSILEKDSNVYMDGNKVNSNLKVIRDRNELHDRRDLGLV